MAGFLSSTLRRRFGSAAQVRYYRADGQPPDEILPLLDLIHREKRQLPVVAVNGRIVSEGFVMFDPVIAAVQEELAKADPEQKSGRSTASSP